MITNELQLRVSKSALRDFEAALPGQYADQTIDELTRRVNIDATQGEMESLRRQIEQYEQIEEGVTRKLDVPFRDLASVIALARVAAGLKQKQLAEQLGMKEQQIQRYEATDYVHASLGRVQEILAMLDCDITLNVTLPINSSKSRSNTATKFWPNDNDKIQPTPYTYVNDELSWTTSPTNAELRLAAS
jgi:ribosome-binding protein aMBF1 (putative translation factor)